MGTRIGLILKNSAVIHGHYYNSLGYLTIHVGKSMKYIL
jgi:hypothetical protein